MMKGASDFMCDTLNDVLSMQKIEEGKLELDLSPFSIHEAVTKVTIMTLYNDLLINVKLIIVLILLLGVLYISWHYYWKKHQFIEIHCSQRTASSSWRQISNRTCNKQLTKQRHQVFERGQVYIHHSHCRLFCFEGKWREPYHLDGVCH